MALADIIVRIESDADAEAAAIISAAETRAAETLAAAREKADALAAQVRTAAEASAGREAATVVVNARLHARDEAVSAHRALVEEALAAAADGIAALPDERYAAFLAGRIAREARGGETLSFGRLDAGRAAATVAQLKALAPQLNLQVSDGCAPFDRGALLVGDRVRADLSLPALVGERRDELELVVAAVLFREGA